MATFLGRSRKGCPINHPDY